MIDFTNILKAYRINNNINQKQLAAKLNISIATMSKIETGKHKPTFDVTLKLLSELMPEFKRNILTLDVESYTVVQGYNPSNYHRDLKISKKT